jgi:hypothetical protein
MERETSALAARVKRRASGFREAMRRAIRRMALGASWRPLAAIRQRKADEPVQPLAATGEVWRRPSTIQAVYKNAPEARKIWRTLMGTAFNIFSPSSRRWSLGRAPTVFEKTT